MRAVAERFGLDGRWALLAAGTHETAGLPYERLRAAARDADVLINISGILADEDLMAPVPVRVYLDLDPAFNQLWHAQGIDMRFGGHTHFVTVGQAIGTPACPVPTCGLDWIPTVPPVVLEHWPRARATTGRARRVHDGRELARLRLGRARGRALRPEGPLDAGADVAPDAHRRGPAPGARRPSRRDARPRGARPQRLAAGRPADGRAATRTPTARSSRGSRAEFGVAKSGYVLSRCGWFSDRSACYLASGRPVLAQDTGFPRFLPTGEGLLAFTGVDDAVAGIEEIRAGYERHAGAARALAEAAPRLGPWC